MVRRILFGALAGFAFTGLAFACTLDLDESLIDKRADGAVVFGDATLPDGTIITESGVPIIPDAGACSKDEECLSANGCLKGRCDLTRRACAYDVCRTAACTVGVCDQGTKTCGQPQTYKLKVSELTLDQPTTGGIVAAYPWLFQLSSTGLVVYDVSNPTKDKPTQVPLVGLGFMPTQIGRSGNRIWMVAPLTGTPARLPIAYIDIPADPFTAKIEAHSVLAGYNRPSTEGIGLGLTGDKNALVIGPAPSFPAAPLDTLLAEPATRTAIALAPKPETTPIAMSGNRLVMQAYPKGTASSQFGLVSGAGTAAPATGELVTITDMGLVSVSHISAQTVGGGVFFAAGAHEAVSIGPATTVVTRAIRGYFLLKDSASPLDPTIKGVDIEVYGAALTSPQLNADLIRAATMVDDDLASVAVAAAENRDETTAVHFIRRDLTVLRDKRVVLPTPIVNVVNETASDGLVYVSANFPSAVDGVPALAKVYVIDPACAP